MTLIEAMKQCGPKQVIMVVSKADCKTIIAFKIVELRSPRSVCRCLANAQGRLIRIVALEFIERTDFEITNEEDPCLR